MEEQDIRQAIDDMSNEESDRQYRARLKGEILKLKAERNDSKDIISKSKKEISELLNSVQKDMTLDKETRQSMVKIIQDDAKKVDEFARIIEANSARISTDKTLLRENRMEHIANTVEAGQKVAGAIADGTVKVAGSIADGTTKVTGAVVKGATMTAGAFTKTMKGIGEKINSLTDDIKDIATATVSLVGTEAFVANQSIQIAARHTGMLATLEKKSAVCKFHHVTSNIAKAAHIMIINKEIDRRDELKNAYDACKTRIEQSVTRRRGLERMKDGAMYMFGKDLPKHKKIVATPEQLKALDEIEGKIKEADARIKDEYEKCQELHKEVLHSRYKYEQVYKETKAEISKERGKKDIDLSRIVPKDNQKASRRIFKEQMNLNERGDKINDELSRNHKTLNDDFLR
jgi:hypothetical protein